MGRVARQVPKLIEELAFDAGKMAFLSGPRQVGKTTVGHVLLDERSSGRYANWDDVTVRRDWVKDPKLLLPPFARKRKSLLVLDEIHKARLWKRNLKGLFDTLVHPVDILVTGSARLAVYKKGSDSLLGRYYPFRLHPFTLREVLGHAPLDPDETLEALLTTRPRAAVSVFESLVRFGGFPEPLFAASEQHSRLWRRGRIEKVVREDLRDLSRIPDLSRIEMLTALLPERVGSPLSVQALREDLEVAHDTVSRWLMFLSELYYAFTIRPWQRSIRRSLRKEPKLYLWDWSEVDAAPARFENLVALHLLKATHFWTDAGLGDFDLHYLRNKEKIEIDFLIVRDKKPWMVVEAKVADVDPSPAFKAFLPQLEPKLAVQIVQTKDVWEWRSVGPHRVLVASASTFFSSMP